MRQTLLLVLLALLAFPPAAHATWGAKSPGCPKWTATLQQLEQSGQTDSPRYGRLRNRIADRCVAMNEIQVLGTHNSYHVQPVPALLAYFIAASPFFEQWEYTHPPLDVQLTSEGIRQVEIDVYADPDGGLFARRGGLVLIGEDPNSGPAELLEPGFKVLHVQDYDFDTTCLTLVDCLQTIKTWSNANENHLPIVVQLELKDDQVPDVGVGGVAIAIPFGPAQMDALDAEIRSVLSPRRLITPDDIRRGHATLEEAVLTDGWPRLGAVREKIMFVMDNGGHYRDDYRLGHPSLEGRVIFTNSTPGDSDGAFVKMNDPLDPNIPATVAAGYLVRTRADADTIEARAGNTVPRDAALASGAQYISTDYPVPNPDFGTGYFVEIPGGAPARCNPVNGPAACRAPGLERLQ